MGILLGIPIAILFGWPEFYIVLLMMVPMVFDGFLQLLTSYESKNMRRFFTGALFGVAFVFALIYFHRTCVHIAGMIVKLFFDDPQRVDRAMEIFL